VVRFVVVGWDVAFLAFKAKEVDVVAAAASVVAIGSSCGPCTDHRPMGEVVTAVL